MSLSRHKLAFTAGLLSIAVVVGACSSTAATQSVAGASQAPVVQPATPAPATEAPSQAPASQAATGTATVLAKTINGQTILVAGSNGMTVYTFTKDTAGSGQSACSGQCLVIWPALTVPAGTPPSGGDGVTGQLGTITRADDGSLQVTYNGLPLYFYQKDTAPGDTNGNYPNWNLVKP
jgi:predicted lipoprotein with Yx(FWY)xxD motif